jgi:hypothetical protein
MSPNGGYMLGTVSDDHVRTQPNEPIEHMIAMTTAR